MKYQAWFKDYENSCWMPLSWAPLFTSMAEGEAWLYSDERDWEFPVRLEQASLCEDCNGLIGNSVTEEVHGHTRCHSCLTTVGAVSMHAPGYGD